MSALTRLNAYEWYLGSEFWAQKRQAAHERAGYVCEVCHKNPSTEVHHKTYERVLSWRAISSRFAHLAIAPSTICGRRMTTN
jgi:hypothetical protein